MGVLVKNALETRMDASGTNDTASATWPCSARFFRQMGPSTRHLTPLLHGCLPELSLNLWQHRFVTKAVLPWLDRLGDTLV